MSKSDRSVSKASSSPKEVHTPGPKGDSCVGVCAHGPTSMSAKGGSVSGDGAAGVGTGSSV